MKFSPNNPFAETIASLEAELKWNMEQAKLWESQAGPSKRKETARLMSPLMEGKLLDGMTIVTTGSYAHGAWKLENGWSISAYMPTWTNIHAHRQSPMRLTFPITNLPMVGCRLTIRDQNNRQRSLVNLNRENTDGQGIDCEALLQEAFRTVQTKLFK
jgi:hypothetical protein